MSSRRTKKEQEAADEFHKDKCCTTKWITCGIVWLFVGLVLMIAGLGIYYAEDLEDFAGAQFKEDCFIRASDTPCQSETCSDRGECSQNTYLITTDSDSTCAVGECPEFDNGCISLQFVTECARQAEYETGDTVNCYAYSGASQSDCSDGNGGRLDPDGEWANAYTSFVVLVVIGVLLIVLAIIFFIIGCSRCMCKKVKDDILGETNGTGCYWCGDYERCCYGEGTGHATIVNQQDRNLPVKDHKRKKKRSTDGGSNGTRKKNYNKQKSRDRDYDDDEEAELR